MAPATVHTDVVGPISIDTVETLSGPQLAAVYRELTGKVTKKFRDRQTGIARVKPVVEARIISLAEDPPPPETRRTRNRRKAFNYPAREVTSRYRPGTKRAILIDTLRDGATFARCQEVTGWNYKQTYENIYVLHSYLGFGLREDEETGVITLFTREES